MAGESRALNSFFLSFSQARWNVSRGLKQGSLNVDNPQLFLKDSKGSRIYVASYNHTFLMDFGSAGEY